MRLTCQPTSRSLDVQRSGLQGRWRRGGWEGKTQSAMNDPPSLSAPLPAPLPTMTTRSGLIGSDISATEHNDNDVAFVCNICLEGVKDRDPVVTQCGHLYCWPCLYRWLNTRQCDGTCPICKAGVTQDNVIPIFIRGSASDPRSRVPAGIAANGVPSRPQGHRPEPVDPNGQSALMQAAYNAQFGGVNFAAGMGFFPSLFGLQFQSFAPGPNGTASDSEDEEHRAYLSRVLLFLGVSVILCLLFF